ncbi:MAG: TVP38/TMEM64 family protein [Planctomycetaceae bacterium]
MQTPCSNSPQPAEDRESVRRRRWRSAWRVVRLIPAIILLVALIAVASPHLDFAKLAEREDQFRESCGQHPLMSFAVVFLIYTVATGLSLPAAAGMTVTTGWLFGFWSALLLVSFASTSGASLAFLASRWFLGRRLQGLYGVRIGELQEAIERDGVQYLLMLRLLPLMPFFLVNLLLGLTRMRLRTFWWASQLGMLPGTAVFVAAGAATPTLRQLADEGLSGIMKPQLMLTFAMLGCLPIFIRWVAGRAGQDERSQ